MQKFIIVFITWLLLASGSFAQKWTKEKELTNDFFGGACFSAGSKVYVGGGLYTNDIYEYDTAAKTWTNKITVPGNLVTCRASAQAVNINGTAYLGFGYDYDPVSMSETELMDLWQYDQGGNKWVKKADFPTVSWYKMPGVFFAIDGKAYMAGGVDSGKASKQVFQYDPATNKWSQKNDLPVGIQTAAFFTLNHKGYLAFCAVDSGATNRLYEYDPASDKWTQKANIPANRRVGPAAFIVDGMAYAGMGGEYKMSQKVVYNDLYVYDAGKDTWKQVSNSPLKGTHICQSAALGNKTYIGFGEDIATGNMIGEWYKISGSTTAVNTLREKQQIVVYPNPAKDELHVTGLPDGDAHPAYNITDISGRVITTGLLTDGRLPVGLLPAGYYLLEVTASDWKVTAAFEKQ